MKALFVLSIATLSGQALINGFSTITASSRCASIQCSRTTILTASISEDKQQSELLSTEKQGHQDGRVNIVLVTGFESFNKDLYRKAGGLLSEEFDVNLNLKGEFSYLSWIFYIKPNSQLNILNACHNVITVFSDSEIRTSPEFESAVQRADIFIGSLIFDYDDVVAVTNLLEHVKGPRLLFECATELMACKWMS